MTKTNALKIRQNLGGILRTLKKNGQPILIEKNREPQAVLISLDDYKKRFVDQEADALRMQLVDEIKQASIKLPKGLSSLDVLNEVRA